MAELQFSEFKEASEVLDYDVDWTTWLNGDTISTSTWAVTSGITQDSESETTAVATIWVSGGTAGNSYVLTNTIVTAGGRTATAIIELHVIPNESTIRSGMYNLVTRLRSMVDGGTADATHEGVVYWSNAQLQDRLDMYSTHFQRVNMNFDVDYTGGTAQYHNYYVPFGDIEEATSGTAYWIVENSDGDDSGTGNYTVDYIRGVVRFTGSQAGSARFVSGYSYNLNRAAAHVWREKSGWVAKNYDFSADDQRFKRGQWFDHCMQMARFYDTQAGLRNVKVVRTDI